MEKENKLKILPKNVGRRKKVEIQEPGKEQKEIKREQRSSRQPRGGARANLQNRQNTVINDQLLNQGIFAQGIGGSGIKRVSSSSVSRSSGQSRVVLDVKGRGDFDTSNSSKTDDTFKSTNVDSDVEMNTDDNDSAALDLQLDFDQSKEIIKTAQDYIIEALAAGYDADQAPLIQCQFPPEQFDFSKDHGQIGNFVIYDDGTMALQLTNGQVLNVDNGSVTDLYQEFVSFNGRDLMSYGQTKSKLLFTPQIQ